MMIRVLRRHLIIGMLLVGLGASARPAELTSGASVYLLSMRYGFDLFLANQLTQAGLLTVVTDPALAEYVLSDSVGAGFEQSMDTLYPKPKEEEPKAEDSAEKDAKEGSAESIVQAYSSATPRASSFSRSDGTYFLVNRHSRAVVWSTFVNHRDTRNQAMNKDAAQLVKRLKIFMKKSAAEAAPAASN